MSRIGKKQIDIPDQVTVTQDGRIVCVKGPKGELKYKTRPEVKLNIANNKISVASLAMTRLHRSLHGLTRTLIQNMVIGVTEGYSKKLEIKGIGYKAETSDRLLILHLGFSHPVNYKLPDGIEAEVKKNIIEISGIDKQLVGEVAAQIRKLKPPEPYKGKGIKYTDEVVRRKAGKAVKAAEVAK